MSRKATSVTLATLRQRPLQRPYLRNPFDKVDYTAREAYQVAAEGYMRGVVNPTPCEGCARGVEPHTRGLPIYPECVSVPLEADADINNPDTKWLMRGACMNCHHRSYTNCSCRKFLRFRMVSKLTRFSGANRRDQHGNAAAPRSQQSPVVPPPGPQPGPSGPSPPSLPSRRGSVAMTDAPPLNFPAGVTTTRSRSEYIREPNVDFSNPEVAERVARMHEQRAADIRAGRIT